MGAYPIVVLGVVVVVALPYGLSLRLGLAPQDSGCAGSSTPHALLINRAFWFKPAVLHLAGRLHFYASVLRHEGRRALRQGVRHAASGSGAHRRGEGGFVIPLGLFSIPSLPTRRKSSPRVFPDFPNRF